jgi:hypothetical protein
MTASVMCMLHLIKAMDIKFWGERGKKKEIKWEVECLKILTEIETATRVWPFKKVDRTKIQFKGNRHVGQTEHLQSFPTIFQGPQQGSLPSRFPSQSYHTEMLHLQSPFQPSLKFPRRCAHSIMEMLNFIWLIRVTTPVRDILISVRLHLKKLNHLI